jgi:hypothetical protein
MAVLGSGNVQIDTYGELKTLIKAITMKQKGLKIKGIIIDTIADELIGKLPGGPTARKTLDFVKAAFGKPDSVKTNTWLDRLDVDDQLSAIVDDTVENKFLQDISKRIEGQSDNTPLRQDFNMNTELVDFLKKNYKGRTVVGPQNEIKKMKKSQLKQLVLEVMRGYSKYAPGGTTDGGTTDDFRNILTAIARGEDQVTRGNTILDKANPENVARITRGEKPVYEEKGRQYAKEDLMWYLDRLEPSTQVTIPRIYPGGFSRTEGWRTTAAKAIDALNQTDLTGKFELYQDNPNYKSFSLVQSDEEMQRMEKLVRGMGSLD